MTRFGQIVVCALLAGAAFAGIRWIQDTEPKAQRTAATKETAMLVEVTPARRGEFSPEIVVLGTVEPERDVRLRPRVSGEVETRSPRFTPGGFVPAKATLLQLDPTDYVIAKRSRQAELDQVRAQRDAAQAEQKRIEAVLQQTQAERAQAEAELEQAQADLEVEEGRQNVALRDYELLEEKLDESQRRLALREPQLAAARAHIAAARTRIAAAEARIAATRAQISAAAASVQAAEARVLGAAAAAERAQKDFERTTIAAPFDAQILSRMVDEGSQVSENDELGRLLGTETYWVVATVALSKLRWLRFPEGAEERGSTVYIHHDAAWGEGRRRVGYVARLIGALDRMTRLARVLVVVPDPLALKPDPQHPDRPRLIVGSLVEARIQAEPLRDVVRIDRACLRQGNTVWVMDEGKLDIRPVEVAFEDPLHVYVRSGLAPGDEVVMTNLATVAQDAALRTAPEPESGEETPPAEAESAHP